MHFKTYFREFLRFYVYSNVHVSLCVAAMIWAARYLLFIEISWTVYLFAFGSTLFLYNVQRLLVAFDFIRAPDEKSERHLWIRRNRNLLAVLAFAGGALALYAALVLFLDPFFVKRAALLRIVFWIGLLSVAYAVPFIRWNGEWLRLRDLPGLKIFLIAFVWSVVVVGMPFLLAKFPDAAREDQPFWYKPAGMVLFLQFFLFCLAITIPFDVRDMKTDKKSIRTIPQLIGEKNALNLGVALLLIVALIQLTLLLVYRTEQGRPFEFFPGHYASLCSTLIVVAWCLLSAFFVRKATAEKNEFYFSFLLDGLLLLLPAGLFIADRV